jgi:hypothetical protein
MNPFKFKLLVLTLVALAETGTIAFASDKTRPSGDPQSLTAKIDAYFTRTWANAGIKPADACDDAEFLRRVSLDLGGRIPSVSHTRAFLADNRPDKRRRLVDELLASPDYINHAARVWRSLLLPETTGSPLAAYLSSPMEDWLRAKLRGNTPYDAMVRELISVPYDPRAISNSTVAAPSPLAFYAGKDFKPENLAAATGRVFLGIKLECAQCHNHPFADWKRDQFWAFAAFFSGLDDPTPVAMNQERKEAPDRRELKIPGTDRVVRASFPDGSEPAWKAKEPTRAVLAAWITRPENPYFSRAISNRMWSWFFGSGLTDPVDEIAGGQNKPAHPQLLDEIAKEMAANRFDLKFVIRAITASRVYQLSSAASNPGREDPQQFARMSVRALSADQLYDSLARATGFREEGSNIIGFGPGGPARFTFLTKFGAATEKSTEVQMSILQALTLMNGKLIADVTSLERSETLAAILDAPFFDTEERVETLYLATLSRKPRPSESSRARQFLEAAVEVDPGQEKNPKEAREKRYKHAFADLFWALLNCGEFYLNH